MSTKGRVWIGHNTSPVLARVYELLKPDGDYRTASDQWFDHEEILLEAMKVIPPAIALRHAETERRQQRFKEKKPPKERVKFKDDYDTQVAAGKRAMARQRIWGSAHIAFRIQDGVKQIRFAPGEGRATSGGVRKVRPTGIDPKHRNRYARTPEEIETLDRNAGDTRVDAVPGTDDATDPTTERG